MASNTVIEPVVDPVVCEYSKSSVQEPLREETVIFDDGSIRLTEDKLVIRWYYFPFGFQKVIPLSKIKKISAEYPRSFLKMKSWGMGMDLSVWWSCDFQRQLCGHRFGRNAIVLDLGTYPQVGLTPGHGTLADAQFVAQKLRELCPDAVMEDA